MQSNANLLRYGPQEHTDEAHWRSLVCDMQQGLNQGNFIRPAPPSFGNLYPIWLDYFSQKPTSTKTAYPLAHAIDVMSVGKRFCVTQEGFVGLVPWRAEPGDIICVFMGSTVPFAIRRRANGNYTLIGECYIHGLMDGEALDVLLDRDDLEESWISLE